MGTIIKVLATLVAGVILTIVGVLIFTAIESVNNSRDCINNINKVFGYTRMMDKDGRIRYYVSIVSNNGNVCYDLQVNPGTFYRIKAEYEKELY